MRTVGLVLVWIGVGLTLTAAIGVLRLPDAYARMNAATKAASLGMALSLAGAAFLLPAGTTTVKLVVAIALQLATAPVAAYAIGRAGYLSGAPLWRETR